MSRDHQHAHRQQSEDVVSFNAGTIYTEPGSINEGRADRAWQKLNILSLGHPNGHHLAEEMLTTINGRWGRHSRPLEPLST